MDNLMKSRQEKPEGPSLMKRIMKGMGMRVKAKFDIFNRSDTMAYIIISDTPIHHVSGVGAKDITINMELYGNYKSQCSYLSPGASRTFESFTSRVYYSVYFKLADGSERVHTIDKLHNGLKNDINILQRHVSESQESTIPL